MDTVEMNSSDRIRRLHVCDREHRKIIDGLFGRGMEHREIVDGLRGHGIGHNDFVATVSQWTASVVVVAWSPESLEATYLAITEPTGAT